MSTSTLRPSAAPLAALGAATEPESRRERRRRERLEEQESTIPVELYGLRRGTVTLLTVLAFLFAIFTLVPIAWILINSTKTQANIYETFGFWFARPFSFFHNFSLLFQNVDGYGTYIQWFGNTALYAVLGGVGATALSAFAGYGFARFSFRGSKLLFYLTIAALLVPITALTLPLYLTYAKAHLINSLWGMVLPSMISPVGIYLMRVYVDISVPRELIDAARLDGAGEARIFFRVALPLMVPGFMTVLLISVVAVWNNYFLPLLIFNINTRYPLTVGLGLWSERAQNSGNAQLFPMVVIGGLVTIIPLIALFLILQRYWRGGLLLGSIANLFRRPCRGGDFPQRIDQGLRDRRGRAGRAGPGHRRRRVRRAGRPLRLRQDDGPANGRGARADHVGDDQLRRPRGQRRVAPAPRRRHGLPELCALPAPFCVPEHRLRAREQEDREGRTGPADPRCRRDSRPGGPARAQAEAVVRRPAAAGGRWAGRSCVRLPCSSWTSRYPTWTPSSGCRCARRYCGCTGRFRPRRCTSRTTRPRR